MTKVAVTLQLCLDDDWRERLPPKCPTCDGYGIKPDSFLTEPCPSCKGTGCVYDPTVPVVDLVASRVMAMTFDGPWTLEGIAAVRQP